MAGKLQNECSSASLRAATVSLLQNLQEVGPLRESEQEFRRVYKSLQWNEPERLHHVVQILAEKAKSRQSERIVRAEAWQYTITALDEWITHARVFYLVMGIVETALRTRIHARLTDYYENEEWPDIDDAVPSGIKNLAANRHKIKQHAEALERLATVKPGDPIEALRDVLATAHAALSAEVRITFGKGDAFLRNTSLKELLMWLETRRFWKEPINMRSLFHVPGSASPLHINELKHAFSTLHEARNAVAHYRPGKNLSLVEPLFAAAKLCSWMGQDLAHVYSSIDTKASTELSTPLQFLSEGGSHWHEREETEKCCEEGCSSQPHLVWLLKNAPQSRENLKACIIERACLLHRVTKRDAQHRPMRR